MELILNQESKAFLYDSNTLDFQMTLPSLILMNKGQSFPLIFFSVQKPWYGQEVTFIKSE